MSGKQERKAHRAAHGMRAPRPVNRGAAAAGKSVFGRPYGARQLVLVVLVVLLGLAFLPAGSPAATAAPAAVWPNPNWPTASPASMGLDEALLDQARDYAINTGGGAGQIIRSGYLVKSWGDTAQLYELKSSTKSVGILALGLALSDGLIEDLDDPAANTYPGVGDIPASNDDAWLQTLTLRHLATHAGGFRKEGGYIDLVYQPGTRWVYSDGGANWLGDTLTYAYGQDLRDLFFTRIFTPLGIDSADLFWRENFYRIDIDKGGQPLENREFGSGISASVDAMSRLGYLFLREGDWQGQQLVPVSFIREATRTQGSLAGLPTPTSLPNGDPLIPAHGAPNHYGLLWWTNSDGAMANVPTDAFWSWGLYENLIVVIPSLDLVVSRAGGGWQTGWEPNYALLEPFLEPIVAAVQNPPPPPGSCVATAAEIERGLLGGEFIVGSAPEASNAGYVYVPAGVVTPLPGSPAGNPHSIRLCVTTPQPGLYHLSGWVNAPDATSNSAFITINGPAHQYLWELPVSGGPQFTPAYLRGSPEGDPMPIPLNAGDQEIVIYLHEDGLRLDRIALEFIYPFDSGPPPSPTPAGKALYLPLVRAPDN